MPAKASLWVRAVCAVVVTLSFVSTVRAGLLLDAELYCDPWSIPTAVYPKIYFDNLNTADSYTWAADTDPVTQAQILPIIAAGVYDPGYVFSIADYYHRPNVDYFADLDGGSLTATFDTAGIYHVRITRQSGQSSVFAILAQAAVGADTEETGATKNIGIPDADLFVVSDSTGDDRYEEMCNRVLTKKGKNVSRATSVAAAAAAINALAAPPKKHVELVGHGIEGAISLGNGKVFDSGKKVLDSENAAAFRDLIKAKVSHLTFLSCNTGGGTDGNDFIDTLDDAIETVKAYDSYVDIIEIIDADEKTVGGYFTTQIVANNVPEPATLSLLMVGGFALIRRRRPARTPGRMTIE